MMANIMIFGSVTRLGGAGNMSCKVLELDFMDACLRKFNMINCELFA